MTNTTKGNEWDIESFESIGNSNKPEIETIVRLMNNFGYQKLEIEIKLDSEKRLKYFTHKMKRWTR